MLFHILHPGVLSHKEAVDAVVLGILVPAVVDAAAGHDDHVSALADEEVVVDDLFQAALGHDHRDMDALVLRSGFDPDLQAAHVLLGDDLDVGGGLPPRGRAVGADVVGAFRHLVKVGHLPQQPLLDLVEFQHSGSSFPAGAYGPSHTSATSPRIRCG